MRTVLLRLLGNFLESFDLKGKEIFDIIYIDIEIAKSSSLFCLGDGGTWAALNQCRLVQKKGFYYKFGGFLTQSFQTTN